MEEALNAACGTRKLCWQEMALRGRRPLSRLMVDGTLYKGLELGFQAEGLAFAKEGDKGGCGTSWRSCLLSVLLSTVEQRGLQLEGAWVGLSPKTR